MSVNLSSLETHCFHHTSTLLTSFILRHSILCSKNAHTLPSLTPFHPSTVQLMHPLLSPPPPSLPFFPSLVSVSSLSLRSLSTHSPSLHLTPVWYHFAIMSFCLLNVRFLFHIKTSIQAIELPFSTTETEVLFPLCSSPKSEKIHMFGLQIAYN